MSLFLNQQNERSELQKRIAAELAEKAKKKSLDPEADRPDGVDDSAYLHDTHTTSSRAWIWIAAIVAILIVLVVLVVASS